MLDTYKIGYSFHKQSVDPHALLERLDNWVGFEDLLILACLHNQRASIKRPIILFGPSSPETDIVSSYFNCTADNVLDKGALRFEIASLGVLLHSWNEPNLRGPPIILNIVVGLIIY